MGSLLVEDLAKRVAVLLGRPLEYSERVVLGAFIGALHEQYVVISKPPVYNSNSFSAADFTAGWNFLEKGSGLPAALKPQPPEPKLKSKAEVMAELRAIVEQRSDELLAAKKKSKCAELTRIIEA